MYLLIIILTDTCLYRLDKDKVVVSELFELLDSVRDQIGIVDWGIKMTTLEDGMTTFSVVINFDCSFCSISQYCEELWEQHYFWRDKWLMSCLASVSTFYIKLIMQMQHSFVLLN